MTIASKNSPPCLEGVPASAGAVILNNFKRLRTDGFHHPVAGNMELMTQFEIDRSIASGYLCPNRWDRFNHFFPAIAMVWVAILFPAFWVYDRTVGLSFTPVITPANATFWLFVIVTSVLACIVFYVQKRRLRLTRIETKLSEVEILKTLETISRQHNWRIISKTKHLVVAITTPPFRSGSWGERITVIFGDGSVFANSICDPAKQSSLVSMGRNRKNVETIVNTFERSR